MKKRTSRVIERRMIACGVLVCAAMAFPMQAARAQTPAAKAPEWKTYSYSTDGFSASFPSEPEITKKNVDTQAGTYELRAYIGVDGDVAVFVGVCDYGAQVAGKDPDTLLQGAKNGALENSKSHLTRETKITLGVYHGLEFEADSDSNHFFVRIYMVGTTIYQTLVVSTLGSPYPETEKFLDSFQLIARTAQ